MGEVKVPEEIQEMIRESNPWVEGQDDLYAKIYRRGLEVGLATQLLCDDEAKERFSAWVREQDAQVVERQKKGDWPSRTCEVPYYGCSGGQLVFTYCPTTVGVAIKVRHEVTGAVLDLSDWC